MLGRTSTDYPGLNSWTHRKETIRFTAPALTWHLAFWHQDDNDAVPDSAARQRTKADLDTLIVDLLQQLGSDPQFAEVKIPQQPQILLFDGIYNRAENDWTLLRRGVESYSPDELRMLRSSYRIVYVTFEWKGFKVTTRFELFTEYWTLTIVASASSDAAHYDMKPYHDRLHALLGRTLGTKAEKDQARREGAELRHYFYRQFWKQFIKAVFGRPLREHRLLRNAFGDFRGVTISDETMACDLQVRTRNTDPIWGRPAAMQLMPLINDESEKHECTASYMLDGRVLYMTTLGPQSFIEQARDRVPVRFIAFVHQREATGATVVNKWQLGRLVSRMHLMGTVRLAALRKLDELYDSGQILGQLEPMIKQARERITDEFRASEAAEAIKSANRKFNEINAKELVIQYRIERSRYYVSQFRQNLPALRLGRVEGFQPYDEFVFRRAGAIYDFIDRLGRRYERATQNLSLLDQYYLAISANRIARIGEVLLFGALVPYYVISLLGHLKGNEEVVRKFYAYPVLIFFATLGLWRYFEMGSNIKKMKASLPRASAQSDDAEGLKEARRNVRDGCLLISATIIVILLTRVLPMPHERVVKILTAINRWFWTY